jgi:predicted RNA-binding protein with RPS1 domain
MDTSNIDMVDFDEVAVPNAHEDAQEDETPTPQHAFSMLSHMIHDARTYKAPEDFKALLDFVIRMRDMSPFNAMLLHQQKPDLKVALTLKQWKKRFNRTLKDHARPLIMMQPFGPVSLVYDVDDTVGQPLSPKVLEVFPTFGVMKESAFDHILSRLKIKNIQCTLTPLPQTSGGSIKNMTPVLVNEKPVQTYLVNINSHHKTATQFVTLLHELAHLALGHLGANQSLSIPERTKLSLSIREVEAEFVAYVVAKRHQIEPESHKYLSGYVEGIQPEEIDIYQVMKSIACVEKLLK